MGQELAVPVGAAGVGAEVAHGDPLEQLRGLEEPAGDLGELRQVLGEGESHDLLVGCVELGEGGQDVLGEYVRVAGTELCHLLELSSHTQKP